MSLKNYNYLLDYIEKCQADGRYSFTLNKLRANFQVSDAALKQSISRLVSRGKIAPVRKGFYVIVPPEYSAKAILPPSLFIDDMLKFMKKNYYVGLLSAAAFYGASHQQPQQFFVVTEKPAPRQIKARGITINFLTKSGIPEMGIENKKTDTGYVRISSPELTALDLIFWEKKQAE